MTLRVLALVVTTVLGLGACSDPTTVLQDEASCPGPDCTDDARVRFEAIAAIDEVAEVARVSRSYGLDRGSAAHAEVGARVADRDAAYGVAVAVLRELDAWPEQEFGTVEATVIAEPAVEAAHVRRETADLTNPHFTRCLSRECEQALSDLRERMLGELDGLREVDLEVAQGVLRVTGRADPDHHALASAGARRLVLDTALRLADRLEVEITARGPLALTLRLEDGLVCEQPPGMHVACEPDNSEPFDNS